MIIHLGAAKEWSRRVLIFALVMTVNGPSHLLATSCSGATPTVSDILASDVVFVADLEAINTEVRPLDCLWDLFAFLHDDADAYRECLPCVMTLRVRERFKGVVPDTVNVDIDGAYQCPRIGNLGVFLDSEGLLLYPMRRSESGLAISLCFGVVQASAVPDHLAELRAQRDGCGDGR